VADQGDAPAMTLMEHVHAALDALERPVGAVDIGDEPADIRRIAQPP
jgi:hypothetical protein